MKKIFIFITLSVLIPLCFSGCNNNANNPVINAQPTVLQTYPGLEGKYYSDGKTVEESIRNLIKNIIPNVLKDEIAKNQKEEVKHLDISSYDISNYDTGDVATIKLNAILKNSSDPIDRTVLVFIKHDQTASGYRSYLLNYHNMDQTDPATDNVKKQLLDDCLSQFKPNKTSNNN